MLGVAERSILAEQAQQAGKRPTWFTGSIRREERTVALGRFQPVSAGLSEPVFRSKPATSHEERHVLLPEDWTIQILRPAGRKPRLIICEGTTGRNPKPW
jgi:hypothetical protein